MSVWALAAATILLWGSAPVLDKVALARLDPLLGVYIRGTVTFTLLSFYLGATGKLRSLVAADARSVLLVVLSGISASLLGQWTYYRALQSGQASQVVPLCSTYPLVAVLLGIMLLRENITPAHAFGVAFVLLGIFLLSR